MCAVLPLAKTRTKAASSTYSKAPSQDLQIQQKGCTFQVFTALWPFIQDVQEVISSVGSSQMLIDVAMVKDRTGRTVEMLHIEWNYHRVGAGNQTLRGQSRLWTPLSIGTLTKSMLNHQWCEDIGDLIHRISDRAARHVDLNLKGPVKDMANSRCYKPTYRLYGNRLERDPAATNAWQEEQMPNYHSLLSRFLPTSTPGFKGGFVCAMPYPFCVRRHNVPYIIVHGSNCDHGFHDQCWANSFHYPKYIDDNKHRIVVYDPSTALCSGCPKDAQLPLMRPDWAWKIASGVDDDDKTYDANQQFTTFTQWEHLERSYADLDQKPVQSDAMEVPIHGVVLLHAWRSMIQHAHNEPVTSTPQYLNPVNWPEFQDANAIIEAFLQGNGASPTGQEARDLYKSTMTDLLTDLASRIWNDPELLKTVPVEVRDHLRSSQTVELVVEHILRRPGLKEFIDHNLRRTIRWQKLRLCQCKEDEMLDAAQTFIHKHGLREDYSNKFLHPQRELLKEAKTKVREKSKPKHASYKAALG